jgi:hypothetical protein
LRAVAESLIVCTHARRMQHRVEICEPPLSPLQLPCIPVGGGRAPLGPVEWPAVQIDAKSPLALRMKPRATGFKLTEVPFLPGVVLHPRYHRARLEWDFPVEKPETLVFKTWQPQSPFESWP